MSSVTLPTGRWGLRAARLFDGFDFVDRATLLVEGDAVVAVGEQLPESVDVLDLGDATLLPGLVDCHQHLVFNGRGTLEEQVTGIDDAALTERARSNARLAVTGGVTTVRDLGDRGFVTLGLRDDPTSLASPRPARRSLHPAGTAGTSAGNTRAPHNWPRRSRIGSSGAVTLSRSWSPAGQ